MSRDILVPPNIPKEEWDKFTRLLYQQIAQINSGKTANTGSVTLDNNASSTVVYHPGFETAMGVYFLPTTTAGAAELANATMFVAEADKASGQFTITHSNDTTNRSFNYVVHG